VLNFTKNTLLVQGIAIALGRLEFSYQEGNLRLNGSVEVLQSFTDCIVCPPPNVFNSLNNIVNYPKVYIPTFFLNFPHAIPPLLTVNKLSVGH